MNSKFTAVVILAALLFVGGCSTPVNVAETEKMTGRVIYGEVTGVVPMEQFLSLAKDYCAKNPSWEYCGHESEYNVYGVVAGRTGWGFTRFNFYLPKTSPVKISDFEPRGSGGDIVRIRVNGVAFGSYMDTVAKKGAQTSTCSWVGDRIGKDGGVYCNGWNYKMMPRWVFGGEAADAGLLSTN